METIILKHILTILQSNIKIYEDNKQRNILTPDCPIIAGNTKYCVETLHDIINDAEQLKSLQKDINFENK